MCSFYKQYFGKQKVVNYARFWVEIVYSKYFPCKVSAKFHVLQQFKMLAYVYYLGSEITEYVASKYFSSYQ